MKPPVRIRATPRRYLTPQSSQQLVWTTREKKELLRGLKEQVSEKAPRVTVDGRSDGEVASYFSWLRSRAAREAIQTEYGKMVHLKKLRWIRDPAPIEVWFPTPGMFLPSPEEVLHTPQVWFPTPGMFLPSPEEVLHTPQIWTDLVSRICSTTEEAMSAAFSQMLTIASTEPVTLHHSIPCKEPPAVSGHTVAPHGQNLQHKESSEAEPSSSGEEPTKYGHHDGWSSFRL
ncbi:unnamed protein product [Ranitomeya imitator]|uniref:Uncharacterized protein n=1 Tax=Ranitomeya imitator TaxID=111125 RepID=A0ABN9LFW8_9NEOB|nr:unnamed protein product [Ranitomeya imitator]